MSSRSRKWVIREDRDGFSLSRGGRQMYSGMGSKAEALRRLKTHYKRGETVHLEEEDGYRTNITETLRRSGVVS